MVLNPMKSVDQHIMDDTDLAGPILFCLLFATFLFLVPLCSRANMLTKGWKKSFWICLWFYPSWNHIITLYTELDVSDRRPFPWHRECTGVLSITTCLDKCDGSHSLTRVIPLMWC
jgi:hypothetical protein